MQQLLFKNWSKRLLDSFNVRRVVLASNLGLVLGTIILSSLAWYGVSKMNRGLTHQYEWTLVERQVHGLLQRVVDSRSVIRGALVSSNPESADQFERAVASVNDTLQSLMQIPRIRDDRESSAALAHVREDIQTFAKVGGETIQIAADPESAFPAYAIFDRDITPAYRRLAWSLAAFEELAWSQHDDALARRTNRIAASLNSMMIAIPSYLFTRSTGVLTEVWVNSRALGSFVATEQSNQPEVQAQLENIRKQYKRFSDATNDALTIQKQPDWRRDLTMFNVSVLPVIDDVTMDVKDLIQQLESDATSERERLQELKSRIAEMLALVTLLSIFVMAFIMWMMKRNVVSRLSNAVGAMKDIEIGGNLNHTIAEDGNDELAMLAFSFNKFVARIRSVVNLVLECSTSLSNESQVMVDAGHRARERVNEQELTINKVAEAVSALSAAVQSIRESTGSANAAATRAQQDSLSGQEIVGRSIAAIQSLSGEVGQIDSVIARVVVEAKAIEAISTAIRDISEQTNLLALNAAIEAARAGESGRGFAVVADEVRTLAMKTRNQTNDINKNLTRLRAEVEQAVEAAKSGLTRAAECNDMAMQAGNALRQINDSVRTITDLNATVAEAVQEQSKAFVAVNEDVLSIREIATETVASATDASRQSAELRTMASQLKDLVSQFLFQNRAGDAAAAASGVNSSASQVKSSAPGEVDLF